MALRVRKQKPHAICSVLALLVKSTLSFYVVAQDTWTCIGDMLGFSNSVWGLQRLHDKDPCRTQSAGLAQRLLKSLVVIFEGSNTKC